jgi:hypothetical protein
VVIDARTQSGYSTTPRVELDGTLAGLNTPGLTLLAGNTSLLGLAINRFEGHGIVITGPGGNSIRYDFIGTNPAGLLALGNGGSGVKIASANNEIFGNVLAGNGGAGLRLEAGADGNSVASNMIGVGFDGTTSLPNGESGIYILGGSGNDIQDNVIAHNNTHGVQVSTGSRNTIRDNSIHSNALLGIELGGNGVTPNDPGDADTGANGLQNYPVLLLATASATQTGVSGTFSGAPSTTFHIDYYVSDSCDPSGYGEGAEYIGTQNLTTSASGQAVIEISSGQLPRAAPGRYLTATATNPQGDTSEFSACRKIDSLPTLVLTGGESGGILQIAEGNPTGGPLTQALTFLAQLSYPSALPVVVSYQTTDGTAQAPSDYLSLSGSLTFLPAVTLHQLVVQTGLDNDPETNETFTLSLGPPTNAVRGQYAIQIVLVDDDGAAGPLALSVGDVGVSEPHTGTRSALFPVSLTDTAFHTVFVDYHTVSGTATAGLDFVAASGQLVFQPGESTKMVPVDVLADAVRENKENFYLVLTNPQGATLGRGQGTATVADPGSFFTLAPCRFYDSRLSGGAFIAGELRTLTLRGSCKIPATAVAVAANLTVAQAQAPGFIEACPADLIAPPTSVLNFAPGVNRANNAIVGLSPDGKATIKNVSTGTIHFVFDVNGYFE